ncbi:EAL domain-containing protein [Palleronia sp. LCG004]|uniref:EAL domain-containing protein n=1 Tax=Palleronia sp. LCG004 TaxID=3079304 RepID=UPI00294314C7|nr:EAL domain-containing protein [Palleronia sp. LCG004]WOI56366.1 EAL domain-containing protein [Palleronia sp. LCG004]
MSVENVAGEVIPRSRATFGESAARSSSRVPERDVIAMVETAVASGSVMLAFQPIVPACHPERPAFFEGLIRLLDQSGRIIPAKDFITEVELSALGRRIDRLSLGYGLDVLGDRPELRLAVNLSAKSIENEEWCDTLDRAIVADPSVAERLILEITESSAIERPDLVRLFMETYRRRGITFAIDDFGSGYTSMRYLKDLCFDILKIDGQFIRGVAQSSDNRALVSAMVSLGRHFDMVTVAEKVETAADAEILRELGVDCLQGYYFGAPTIRPRWDSDDKDLAVG